MNQLQLSDRQRNILNFIIDFTDRHDFPPTIREIGLEVGISSTSVVNYNLARLVELELLTREKEVSRGLSLNRFKLMELGFLSPEEIEPDYPQARRRKPERGRIRVPILGKIAAGVPIDVAHLDAEAADDWIELAEELLGRQDKLFALRVEGNSMIDASVLDGDIVILRQTDTANDGDMVAAWVDDYHETTLKYLYRQGNMVRLQPANPNPEYKPMYYPADRVQINGKVVSVIRVLH
jgi:repressor LexA